MSDCDHIAIVDVVGKHDNVSLYEAGRLSRVISDLSNSREQFPNLVSIYFHGIIFAEAKQEEALLIFVWITQQLTPMSRFSLPTVTVIRRRHPTLLGTSVMLLLVTRYHGHRPANFLSQT